MNIPPILLAKAFIIMAFVGAFIEVIRYRYHLGFEDTLRRAFCGAVQGVLVLAVLVAAVEALIFLFK